jgi:hypothetical protein
MHAALSCSVFTETGGGGVIAAAVQGTRSPSPEYGGECVLGVRRTTGFSFGRRRCTNELDGKGPMHVCVALVCSFCTRSGPREDGPDLTSDPRFHGREDHARLCFSLIVIRRYDDCCTTEALITAGIDEITFPAASVVHLSQSKAITRIRNVTPMHMIGTH